MKHTKQIFPRASDIVASKAIKSQRSDSVLPSRTPSEARKSARVDRVDKARALVDEIANEHIMMFRMFDIKIR